MSVSLLPSLGEKRKLENMNQVIQEVSSKRAFLEDVLDLRRKPVSFGDGIGKFPEKVDDDVILLSDDEDDQLINALREEMEKENAPKGKVLSKTKLLISKIENELRNEESTLLLLQQLRANQRSHSIQSKDTKGSLKDELLPSHNAGRITQGINPQVRSNGQSPARTKPSAPRINQSIPQTNLPSALNTIPSAAPKVTKAMAIQTLKRQCNDKKAALQKQLDRALERVALPIPSGNASSEVTFVPSGMTIEFGALLGLEEIVDNIQEFDPSNYDKVLNRPLLGPPLSCSRCGTDFTPVWKGKRSDSTGVTCEACIVESQRSSIHKSYHNIVSKTLKQHVASERELEQEYEDIVNTPTKLDTVIKEHERKALATHQAQLAQQQQYQQQQQSSNAVNNFHNQHYNQPQSFQSQGVFSSTGSRHAQTNTVNSAAANHLPISSNNSRRQSTSNSALITPVSSSTMAMQQQNQVASNVVQQFTSQYQQLSKAAAAVAAATSGQNQSSHAVSNSNVANNLLMAAATNPILAAAAVGNQQQQQLTPQQLVAAAAVQQRLAAAAALSGFQHQQAPQASTNMSSTGLDQFTQAFLMNSLLCGAANAANQAVNSRQQQQLVQQTLLHYTYLCQQQQQAAAAAQAQQQQQQQQQQHQQASAAVLQQLMGSANSNPAACAALLQNLWALNAAANGANSSKK